MGEVLTFPQPAASPLVLTHSEMASWLTCQRGWWLSYYMKLKRIYEYESAPSVGTMFHNGLEKFYKGELDDPAMYIASQAGDLVSAAHPEDEDQIVKDVEMASIMLQGYMEWVETEGADVGLEVVGVEQGVEQVVGPFILRGKIDARVRREWDGALLQLEHKTCGSLEDIPKYAQAAPQFLTYDLLAFLEAKNGGGVEQTDGVLLNMARKVKRTVRAKPPFYGRFEVRHNVEELRAHYRHIITVGNQIFRARAALDQGWSHHDVLVPHINRNHTWACRCRHITPMLDDGSDVDSYLQDFYEPYDPLERYNDGEEE